MAFRQHAAAFLAFAFVAAVIILAGRHGNHGPAGPVASSFDTHVAAVRK